MPYLQFVKFLIMELNFIHCTTLHKWWIVLSSAKLW